LPLLRERAISFDAAFDHADHRQMREAWVVEPDARGDPMSPLRWTCKSLRRLAVELNVSLRHGPPCFETS
jgi:hypothetical protein